MARDDEFRKVAEDVRALARSLARDFRDAVDQARRSGQPTSTAFRHGLQGMADEARRSMRSSWPGASYQRYYKHYYKQFYRHGWGYPPPPPGPPGPVTDTTAPAPSPSWGRARPYRTCPPWPRPPRSRPQRPTLPPVRRRWDATTVIGMLAVLFGVAWLLGALHAMSVPVEGVVAAGLMLLGASLIVTGRTDWSLSRHSWPVWLGVGLIVVLIVTSAGLGVGGALNHVSFGDMSKPAVAGKTVYGGFGNFTVDATHLKAGDTVKVESVAGETFIQTPPGVLVQVHARVLAGQICVKGKDRQDGVNADVNQTFGSGSQPVVLDVHQVFGQLLIGSRGCSQR